MVDKTLYHYRAIVTSAYDGDTITVNIDLGLGVWKNKQKLRLYGIDTPELRGDERELGLEVRDWVRNLVVDKEIILQSIRDRTGKYGRWLAIVWFQDDKGIFQNLNEMLIEKGYPAPDSWN